MSEVYTGEHLTVKKIETNNSLDVLKYAEIYAAGEIKRFLYHLYKGVIYVIGLEVDEQPAGFYVIERQNDRHHVCTTVFLHHTAKNRGYEKLLLEKALEVSKAEGAEHFYISYFQGAEERDRLKNLYESFGFRPSGYTRHTFVLDRREVGMAIQHMCSKYARHLHDYHHQLRVFKDLTSETVQRIKAQRGSEIPDNFYPLTRACCAKCSTMIWRDNDPAGWIVFEANGNTALYVHQIFIKEKYRNKGLFIPLLDFAYQNTPESVKRYFFYVNGDNTSMLGLLRLFHDCHPRRDLLIEMTRKI